MCWTFAKLVMACERLHNPLTQHTLCTVAMRVLDMMYKRHSIWKHPAAMWTRLCLMAFRWARLPMMMHSLTVADQVLHGGKATFTLWASFHLYAYNVVKSWDKAHTLDKTWQCWNAAGRLAIFSSCRDGVLAYTLVTNLVTIFISMSVQWVNARSCGRATGMRSEAVMHRASQWYNACIADSSSTNEPVPD